VPVAVAALLLAGGTPVIRLLKELDTGPPEPDSLTTIKARNAVNTRWARERERNATSA
jgi:hypothetical protein